MIKKLSDIGFHVGNIAVWKSSDGKSGSHAYELYLITGSRAGGEYQHSSTTFLEGRGEETSHTGRDATILRVFLS